MKKALTFISILFVELIGLTLMGYLYSIDKRDTILILLVVSVLVVALTSILFTYLLVDKKEKKDYSKCPYFIEKD